MKIPDIKGRIRAVKNIFDPALGADALPLDLLVAVVDDIENHSTSVGLSGRRFPYNRIVVRLYAGPDRGRTPLETAFQGLEPRVRERFGEIGCPVPPGFSIRTVFVKRIPTGWTGEQRFSVEYSKADQRDQGAEPAAASGPELKITVLKGKAAKKAYTFPAGTTILIGRMTEVRDTKGGLRLNHIAFDDSNTTVSRAHMKLKYDKEQAAYSVVDERSAHGTLLLRNGTWKKVPADLRGVRIHSGDEIQLGDAHIRITIG